MHTVYNSITSIHMHLYTMGVERDLQHTLRDSLIVLGSVPRSLADEGAGTPVALRWAHPTSRRNAFSSGAKAPDIAMRANLRKYLHEISDMYRHKCVHYYIRACIRAQTCARPSVCNSVDCHTYACCSDVGRNIYVSGRGLEAATKV